MKKFFNVRTIAGLGVLSAIVIILQIFANYISFGPISITLSLIPIVIGACIYGPLAGLFLGMLDGLLIIFAPSTFSLFIPQNAIGTVILCLLKTGIAGLVSGFVFKAFEKKHPQIGCILAAIVVPIINTGMFVGASFLIYLPLIESFTPEGQTTIEFVLFSFVGINFIVEFLVNSILSPVIYNIYKLIINKQQKQTN